MAMRGVGGEGEQVEGIVGTLKVPWPFGILVVLGDMRHLRRKARFLWASEGPRECLNHNVPRPQAFFTKAYVPLECKPCVAELEMRKKELLVSSLLPHGQAIRFKMKLRVGSCIILDEIRNFESSGNFHLREYIKVLQIPNCREIFHEFPLRGPLFLH
ncbi:uncharacterized protein G2W53_018253 [Senna tora]|uniref:Uncharacterized protein n=1 Tax=Senna tora TaxID=362788 RepID=A0A834WRH7_9FABA|nr:uncharacterized protein G2W53_018253 [Senna tora]